MVHLSRQHERGLFLQLFRSLDSLPHPVFMRVLLNVRVYFGIKGYRTLMQIVLPPARKKRP